MKKNKVKPVDKTYYKNHYIISEENYYIVIHTKETKYLKDQKCLRIIYSSDGPDKNIINKFIQDCYPKLAKKIPSIYYFDNDWHFTKDGIPYGLVLVFYS